MEKNLENQEQVVEKTQENDSKKKVAKGLNIAFNVVFYAVIAFLLLFSIANLSGLEEKTPSLFGYYFVAPISESMVGNRDDSFGTSDLLFVKKANNKMISNMEVDKVYTFNDISIDKSVSGNQFNTHRYVGKKDQFTYVFQGDYVGANPDTAQYVYEASRYESDSMMRFYCQEVVAGDIVGEVKGIWRGGADVLRFLQSKKGFIWVIVVPTSILICVEGFFIVKNVLLLNKQKFEAELASRQESTQLSLEEEREKMRQELLAELAKQQAESQKPQEENNAKEEEQKSEE